MSHFEEKILKLAGDTADLHLATKFAITLRETGLTYLATSPPHSPNPGHFEDTNYGKFATLLLDDGRIWGFDSEKGRDQFVADTGAKAE